MSTVSSLSAVSGLAPSAASQSSNPSQTLNQADFLQLLVTQMTSQDPLDPESDTDMAAQMAQFSSLQASENTEHDIEGLQANALLGQTVNMISTGAPQTGAVRLSAVPKRGRTGIDRERPGLQFEPVIRHLPKSANNNTHNPCSPK